MIPPDSLHVLRGEVRATYPVPFLVGSSLVAGIPGSGLGVACDRAAMAWARFGTGIALLVTATGITLFGIVRCPDLLKSERTRFAGQVLQMVGNDDISRPTGERVIRMAGHYLDRSASGLEGFNSRKIAAPDGESEEDVVALKDAVKGGDGFSHWWNHIPGVFLVTSRLTADEITDRLRPITGESRILVMAVHLEDSEGWLPQEGWKWIKRRTRELRPLSHASSEGA